MLVAADRLIAIYTSARHLYFLSVLFCNNVVSNTTNTNTALNSEVGVLGALVNVTPPPPKKKKEGSIGVRPSSGSEVQLSADLKIMGSD